MKNLLKVFLIILSTILCLAFVACGDSGSAGLEEAPGVGGSGDSIVNNDINRKVVYTVDIDIETQDVANIKSVLVSKSLDLGGYIESADEDYDGGVCTGASIKFRIPTENLNEFIVVIEGFGNLSSKNIDTKDITSEYIKAQARKTSLDEKLDLLQSNYNEAVTNAEKLAILDEITEVKADILALEIAISDYDSELKYSTVYVGIGQEDDYSGIWIALFLIFGAPGIAVALVFIIIKIMKSKKKKTTQVQ